MEGPAHDRVVVEGDEIRDGDGTVANSYKKHTQSQSHTVLLASHMYLAMLHALHTCSTFGNRFPISFS